MIDRVSDWCYYRFGIELKTIAIALGMLVILAAGGWIAGKWGAGKVIADGKNWLYWEYRSMRYDGVDSVHSPVRNAWANLDGMSQDGAVVLRVYEPSGPKQIKAYLADLDLKDKIKAARYINALNKASIKVDYYQLDTDSTDYVVIWIDGDTPLNQTLIEQGIASPIDRPPTNIINTMMARYYHQKFLKHIM